MLLYAPMAGTDSGAQSKGAKYKQFFFLWIFEITFF